MLTSAALLAPVILFGQAPIPCEALARLSIPAKAVALPTEGVVIRATVRVAAGGPSNPASEYCQVTGWIRQFHFGSHLAQIVLFQIVVRNMNPVHANQCLDAMLPLTKIGG